jgi:hypothetical protein
MEAEVQFTVESIPRHTDTWARSALLRHFVLKLAYMG